MRLVYPTERQLFITFLVFRIISVYLIRSSFVPDEYWQSLEVSHKMTFGYGHLTWEWDKKIRSCVYPFIVHLLYKIVPDSTFFIIHSPRIFQAILSSTGDYFTYKFVSEYFGKNCGLWTALNILASWFLFYCSPRTLTNMAEASLTSIGIYLYPWRKRKKYRLSSKYIWFAGASAVMRPTAIVTWLPLYIWHIWRERNLFLVIKDSLFIGFIILATMLLTDKWCYKSWVLTPYNFFLFNWSSDIGAFYGSHNLLWYYLIGLPVVLGVQVIPFILGASLPLLKPFYMLILWILLIFSVPSHKEFRFLLPIMHLCMAICGVVMNEIWSNRMYLCSIKINKKFSILFSVTLLLIHIPMSLYMGLYHQRGVIDATVHLSKTVDVHSSVLFLMPCHSTPYYSYIHKPIKMKFLTCEPNFQNDDNYVEEADEFFTHPQKWLSKNYELNNTFYLPSHIVMFDNLYPRISDFLVQHHYRKCFTAFHSHFADGRTGKFVHIYCK